MLSINLKGQWEILKEGFRGSLGTIDFVNENTGWITGSENLFKTEDGGENWYQIDSEFAPYEICFISESHGWGISSYWDEIEEISKYIIIKSTDGGLNWSIQCALPAENHYLRSIYIVNENIGYAAGFRYFSANDSRAGIIFKTNNGGENWYDISPDNPNLVFEQIWFFDEKTGIIFGRRYDEGVYKECFVLRTFDGGITWREQIYSRYNQFRISNFEFLI